MMKEGFKVGLKTNEGGELRNQRHEEKYEEFFRVYVSKTNDYCIEPTNEDKEGLFGVLFNARTGGKLLEDLSPADREIYNRISPLHTR